MGDARSRLRAFIDQHRDPPRETPQSRAAARRERRLLREEAQRQLDELDAAQWKYDIHDHPAVRAKHDAIARHDLAEAETRQHLTGHDPADAHAQRQRDIARWQFSPDGSGIQEGWADPGTLAPP